jgi:hypothetical protein
MTGKIDHGPADILRQLLLNMGVLRIHTSAQWPSFAGLMPDTPDSLIVVMATTPLIQGRLMTNGEMIYKPAVQVLGRGIDREALWLQIMNVHDALTKIKRSPVTYKAIQYRIDNASISSGPVDLGIEKDSPRRRFFASVNAILTIARVA